MRQFTTEYLRAVLYWWWVVTIGIGAGGAAFAFNLFDGVTIPIWAWIGLAILGVFIAQVLAYREIRNKYIEHVILPDQIEGILINIAKLRNRGEEIRFAGLNLKNTKQIPQWGIEHGVWRKQVELEIEKLSPSEAKYFSAGYIVDAKLFRKKALNDKHQALLGAITLDIERIQKLIERLSPQNLAKRCIKT